MLITDKPEAMPSTNALDGLPDEEPNGAAPAYLSFGPTPCPLVNPPEIDEVKTYVVRVRCTGKTESERTDGEVRHGRKLTIQWCIPEGAKPPIDPSENQPGLFDDDDPAGDERDDAPDPQPDADYNEDDFSEFRPPFSDGGQA